MLYVPLLMRFSIAANSMRRRVPLEQRRNRYVQAGTSSVRLVGAKETERSPEIWVWRYHEGVPGWQNSKRGVFGGDVKQYPTKAVAWQAAESLGLAVANPPGTDVVDLRAPINRFLREAFPESSTSLFITNGVVAEGK
jgi:hypothetical protein